jgi:ribose 5-phosphate isomerase A
VEALPFALRFVSERIERLGGGPALRRTAEGDLYRTDQGNAVLDCAFGLIDAPERLAVSLSQIPGILGHGMFIDEIDALYLGHAGGVDKRERKSLP